MLAKICNSQKVVPSATQEKLIHISRVNIRWKRKKKGEKKEGRRGKIGDYLPGDEGWERKGRREKQRQSGEEAREWEETGAI